MPTRVRSRCQRCNIICNRKSERFKLPQRAPVAKGFWKIFASTEWSLFSSTVHHDRKTAHDFEQVDDVGTAAMSDILAMHGITVFSSQNIVHISISLSSST